jgi:hypothetical protein
LEAKYHTIPFDEAHISKYLSLHTDWFPFSLQELVKSPLPPAGLNDDVLRRWPEDDVRAFIRGLKAHGKNFFRIRYGHHINGSDGRNPFPWQHLNKLNSVCLSSSPKMVFLVINIVV